MSEETHKLAHEAMLRLLTLASPGRGTRDIARVQDYIFELQDIQKQLVHSLRMVMATAENVFKECTDGEQGTLADYPSFKAAREALKKAGAL